MKYLRSVLGVILGAVVATVLMMVAETGNFLAFKPTEAPGIDDFGKLKEWMDEFQKDPKQVTAWVNTLPIWAMVVVQLGWAVGTFAGAWVSAKIAGWAHLVHGLIIGALILIGTIANFYELKSHGFDHPSWMIVLGVLLPIPVAFLASKLATPSSSKPAAPSALPSSAKREGEPPVRPTF
jgi:hypothetical protein